MGRSVPTIGVRALMPVLVVMLVLAACLAPAGQTESDPNSSVTKVDAVEPAACSGMPTSANQEGPYYSAGSPEKANLVEEGMAGSPVRIVGQMFDTFCTPIAGAKLDFWQADFDGVYDNVGYTLRGHVFTDEDGAYALESIEPGPYTGRPPHIHVKVFALDGQELLTSQIYTSGSEDSADVRDAPDLLATYVETDAMGVKQVLFDFVVETNE